MSHSLAKIKTLLQHQQQQQKQQQRAYLVLEALVVEGEGGARQAPVVQVVVHSTKQYIHELTTLKDALISHHRNLAV